MSQEPEILSVVVGDTHYQQAFREFLNGLRTYITYRGGAEGLLELGIMEQGKDKPCMKQCMTKVAAKQFVEMLGLKPVTSPDLSRRWERDAIAPF